MSTKHLSGWRAAGCTVHFGDSGISLHQCGPMSLQEDRARLIGAAPELLAMLDDSIQHEWNPFEPNNQSARYHRMVALRFKATGSAS